MTQVLRIEPSPPRSWGTRFCCCIIRCQRSPPPWTGPWGLAPFSSQSAHPPGGGGASENPWFVIVIFFCLPQVLDYQTLGKLSSRETVRVMPGNFAEALANLQGLFQVTVQNQPHLGKCQGPWCDPACHSRKLSVAVANLPGYSILGKGGLGPSS